MPEISFREWKGPGSSVNSARSRSYAGGGRFREEVAEYSERELGFRLILSAGAASFPSDAGDPDGLLEAADTAMYRAKRRGKDQLYHRFMDAG
jgi:GGDEF domain-containing protein